MNRVVHCTVSQCIIINTNHASSSDISLIGSLHALWVILLWEHCNYSCIPINERNSVSELFTPSLCTFNSSNVCKPILDYKSKDHPTKLKNVSSVFFVYRVLCTSYSSNVWETNTQVRTARLQSFLFTVTRRGEYQPKLWIWFQPWHPPPHFARLPLFE